MENETYRILAEGQVMSNDTWKTGLNGHDLILGGSGAGKTRSYVKPNIMQCTGSFIVADTKGELKKELEGVLREQGYQVVEIDFTDCIHSAYGYNPLAFIHYLEDKEKYNEQDILTVTECLVPIEDFHSPFWDLAARMFLGSILGYIMEALPDEEHTLYSAARLLMAMGQRQFEILLNEFGRLKPESMAVTFYKMYQASANADRMYSSIIGVLAEKLCMFTFDGARALFENTQTIRFSDIGRKKTAVFLHISDLDRSMDKLVNLFYTQALQALCQSADNDYEDHRLPVPVRFILDDFAAGTYIPDFDKIISVIRSREISVSVILQSISQLDAVYGHYRSITILNNCDNCLYLGGQDVETARYISIKANKSIHSILNMPLDNAWLFTRGSEGKKVRKFNLKNHERYKELPEYKKQHKNNAKAENISFNNKQEDIIHEKR